MTPKSNNSQHGMSPEQAAANVAGSYAAHWAAAHTGTEIHGGYARPDSETTAASSGEPSEDI